MAGREAVLRGSDIFSVLNERELRALAAQCQWRRYAVGDCLYQEGEGGSTLLLIAQGQVALARRGQGGRSMHIGRVISGGTIGKMALLDSAPRSATAMALTAVEALEIRQSTFLALLKEDPQLASKILARISHMLSGRLRRVVDRLEDELLLEAEDDDILNGAGGFGDRTVKVLPETLVDERHEMVGEEGHRGELWRVLWGIQK